MATPIKTLRAFDEHSNKRYLDQSFNLTRECEQALARVKERIRQNTQLALSDLYYSRITTSIKLWRD